MDGQQSETRPAGNSTRRLTIVALVDDVQLGIDSIEPLCIDAASNGVRVDGNIGRARNGVCGVCADLADVERSRTSLGQGNETENGEVERREHFTQ